MRGSRVAVHFLAFHAKGTLHRLPFDAFVQTHHMLGRCDRPFLFTRGKYRSLLAHVFEAEAARTRGIHGRCMPSRGRRRGRQS